MSRRSSKRRLQRALLACAIAAALAGCGEDAEPTTDTTAPEAATVPDVSPLRERLDRLVTRLLTERGLDPAVTECALAELADTLPDAQLQAAVTEIRKTGAAPPGVVEAATAAGQACGRP